MFDPTLPPNSPQKLALQTRKGGVIDNIMDPSPVIAGVQLQMNNLRARFDKAMHRDVGPSGMYNCHGLTFAARRAVIEKPSQIQKILDDDGYRQLVLGESPSPGDIAIYREQGDIIHSGIVAGKRDGEIMILGKVGNCHEMVHPERHCPYNAAVTYYRLQT